MDRKIIEKRMQIFLAIVGAFFLVLVIRLGYMQLFQNDRFSTLARENRMRLITITAPRGEVFDRKGVRLVGNQPVYTVSINLGNYDLNDVVNRLAAILNMKPADIMAKVQEQKEQMRLYEPIRVAINVSPEVVTRISEQRMDLPGVVVDIEPVRFFPAGNILTHVMGYVRQINKEQLEAHKEEGYNLGDQFGQTGLEYVYEKYLRGKDGARQVEVDSMARPVRPLEVVDPMPGNNLVLTIDESVQKAAEDALARSSKEAIRLGHKEATAGTAVALDVRTGAVLAMASFPTYDASKLSGDLSPADYNQIFNNKLQPLLNRALLPYAPGSTFKMIVAMAGLESGKIKPTDAISDPGIFYYGGTSFIDWVAGGHGRVDLIKAIKVSCDIYFYRLGVMTGIDEIARVAREFGLGEKTGIDLPGEETGYVAGQDTKFSIRLDFLGDAALSKAREIEAKYNQLLARVTSNEEKRALYKKRSDELIEASSEYSDLWEMGWHDYDMVISSIGQGDNRYTMLQLANYIATIANGGTRYKPYLVQRVVDPNGKVLKENAPQALGHANISPKTLALIRQGMHEVTLPPDGTAYGLFDGLPPAAAKTGTAEIYGHDTHAVFVAYAPFANPEIAVAVVMEYAGHGGTAAGPVGAAMLDAYFGVKVDYKYLFGTE
ncbi:MAG: penicillin-binding protein 2 [Eubacteriales bacterium]